MIPREYLYYEFAALRDMGRADPEFPMVDLCNALAAGLIGEPRLTVATHFISSSAGHRNLRGFHASHWNLPVFSITDDAPGTKTPVRRECTFSSGWIKMTNTGDYFSPGDNV